MNIDGVARGLVLDHIEAGRSMELYRILGLDKLDCCVAIIKNARSSKTGRKDIMKIEDRIDLDLDALGFIDPNITVNIIDDGQIVEKKKIRLPRQVTNIIRCTNPRCITSVEQGLPHVFELADEEKGLYRCKYCDQVYNRKKRRML